MLDLFGKMKISVSSSPLSLLNEEVVLHERVVYVLFNFFPFCYST